MKRFIPPKSSVIFSKSRYVSPPKKGVAVPKDLPDPTIGVPMVEETIPGPMPVFIPWIIINPTSIGYYCW